MEMELQEATRRYSERDWHGALTVLASVESNDENHLDVAYLLGLCHARLEEWEEALMFLEQVVTASDDFLRICQCRLALAYAYSMTGRSRLAEYELDSLVKMGFRSVPVLSALGHTSWVEGKPDDALNWYTAALEADPESPNALNGLGYVLACEGKDIARALTCCRKAVDRSPQNPAYLDSLGWAYHRLGFETEAREHISRALAIAPSESEIREHALAIGIDVPPLSQEYEA